MKSNKSPFRNTLAFLGTALLGAGLMGAYGWLLPKGFEYKGPLLLLKHFLDPAAVLLFFLGCACLGRWVLIRLLPPGSMDTHEELLYSIGLGTGIVATAVLIAGSAALLRPAVLAPLFFSALFFSRAHILPVLRAARQGAAELLNPSGGRAMRIAYLATLAVFGLFLLAFALMPVMDWDSLMYHLEVPSAFVRHHRIFLPPANPHVSLVGMIHMVYIPLLMLGCTAGPSLVSALLAMLLSLAVFTSARRVFDLPAATLATTMLWGTTTIVFVAVTPRNDVTLAFFLLLAHHALLRGLLDDTDRSQLWVAAALAGLAAGVKITAVFYLVGFIPLFWLVRPEGGNKPFPSPGTLAKFAAIVALVCLPWYLKNVLMIGKPFHSFVNEPILHPWLAALTGTGGLPSTIPPGVHNIIWSSKYHVNLLDVFFFPRKLSLEGESIYYYTNPALLLLPLWIFFRKYRRLQWVGVPALAYIILLVWFSPQLNPRFLIPAAVPLTVVVAALVVQFSDRFVPANRRGFARLLLLVLVLQPSLYAVSARVGHFQALEYLGGRLSATDYMFTFERPEVRKHTALVQLVNKQLPPDSRILMLYDARGYYLEREVLQDNMANNWPILAELLPEGACFDGLGITHVILALDTVGIYSSRQADVSILRWEEFTEFADRCLEATHEGFGYVVFAVRPQAGVFSQAPQVDHPADP